MEKIIKMSDDYSETSEVQKAFNDYCKPFIKKLITHMHDKYPKRFDDIDNPFLIQDLGSADGSNSINNLKFIIEEIRKLNSKMPIQIYLNDLPANNFSKLITNVEEGLKDFEMIYISGIARSFYAQIVPNKSFDFSMCFFSIHWTPEVPAVLDNFSFFFTKDLEINENSEKWIKFLKNI